MNIIEAYKLARGKRVRRHLETGEGETFVSYDTKVSIDRFLNSLVRTSLLADDWEVVKEKKTWTGTWEEALYKHAESYWLRAGTVVNITLEE